MRGHACLFPIVTPMPDINENSEVTRAIPAVVYVEFSIVS